MDERFQSNKGESAIIESWMLSVVHGDRISRFDDLHIDRINPDWKSSAVWITATVRALDLASAIRDRLRLQLTVAAGFSLRSEKRPIGVDFDSPKQFESRFTVAPPSLYLFKLKSEPWTTPSQALIVTRIRTEILGSFPHKECWYIEFAESNDYFRSVFVTNRAE